jgi:hypothetical protein
MVNTVLKSMRRFGSALALEFDRVLIGLYFMSALAFLYIWLN